MRKAVLFLLPAMLNCAPEASGIVQLTDCQGLESGTYQIAVNVSGPDGCNVGESIKVVSLPDQEPPPGCTVKRGQFDANCSIDILVSCPDYSVSTRLTIQDHGTYADGVWGLNQPDCSSHGTIEYGKL